MHKHLFDAMSQSIIDGEAEDAARLAAQAIEQGIPPLEAINRGFVPGMDTVGAGYHSGELFLPDLVLAAEAMKSGMAVLEPELARLGAGREVLGKIVIGTVQGDIHDIGKTLVATMLSTGGFEVYDLGVSVPVKAFVDKAKETGAQMVAMSALLTTTMVRQREVIEALEAAGLRPGVKVMVGGAPVTRRWAEQIGADGFSEDAIGAVVLAKQLLGCE